MKKVATAEEMTAAIAGVTEADVTKATAISRWSVQMVQSFDRFSKYSLENVC